MARIIATVIGLYLSHAPHQPNSPIHQLELDPRGGVIGDSHGGTVIYDPDEGIIPNPRQFTIVSPAELAEIAAALRVPFINPVWLSANIVLSGIDRLTTTLVPGTRLVDATGQPILEIKGITEPCLDMGKRLAELLPVHQLDAKRFPKLAYNKRGVHGLVLEPTVLHMYDTLTAVLPDE